ncbi:Transposable element tcb2 transposase [Caligus rogercresseyi]|uniref:Transposable element tcb2 transposase n=1 Tax=Caligus rogercresseyi TaxID=217165 RepID=A0A7T8QUT8_CALRO|nr:Transposable element tcb2 transposase [Caligus rogercresseyi]
MRKQAKNLGVSKDTIRNAVQDLGLVSYVRRRRQLLSDASKETRVIKGKKLLTWMKHNGSTVRIFSDKKLWTVDQVRNSRNDRYLAYCIEEVPPINTTKHPASAMMLEWSARMGTGCLHSGFPRGSRWGQRVLGGHAECGQAMVGCYLPEGNYVFQQDSAPGHKAKITQKWCEENLAAFCHGPCATIKPGFQST